MFLVVKGCPAGFEYQQEMMIDSLFYTLLDDKRKEDSFIIIKKRGLTMHI